MLFLWFIFEWSQLSSIQNPQLSVSTNPQNGFFNDGIFRFWRPENSKVKFPFRFWKFHSEKVWELYRFCWLCLPVLVDLPIDNLIIHSGLYFGLKGAHQLWGAFCRLKGCLRFGVIGLGMQNEHFLDAPKYNW